MDLLMHALDFLNWIRADWVEVGSMVWRVGDRVVAAHPSMVVVMDDQGGAVLAATPDGKVADALGRILAIDGPVIGTVDALALARWCGPGPWALDEDSPSSFVGVEGGESAVTSTPGSSGGRCTGLACSAASSRSATASSPQGGGAAFLRFDGTAWSVLIAECRERRGEWPPLMLKGAA